MLIEEFDNAVFNAFKLIEISVRKIGKFADYINKKSMKEYFL